MYMSAPSPEFKKTIIATTAAIAAVIYAQITDVARRAGVTSLP
jgi:hypothetical protein